MFTGIITDIGLIASALEEEGALTLEIVSHYPADDLTIGESIACNGACLTVTAIKTPSSFANSGESRGKAEDLAQSSPDPALSLREPQDDDYCSRFAVTLSSETLARTVPGCWETGRRLNLERAIAAGERFGGHFVTGHVDGLATLELIEPEGECQKWTLSASPPLARYLAAKGSVTLDGVSLTVNQTSGNRFTLMLIPHTLASTILSEKQPGDALHLEIDLIARYVENLLNKN